MPAIYHEGSWLGNATDPEVLVKDTVGWTGKNKFPLTLSNLKSINTSGSWNGNSYTHNDVTYTITAENDIVTNIASSGTASTSGGSNLFLWANGIPSWMDADKDYILSGCASDGSVSTYSIQYNNWTEGATYQKSDNGNGVTIRKITDSTTQKIRIWIRQNVDASGLNFKPMVRDASITDPTYEPYHESVEEEIEQIYADNGVLGAKNLLNITSDTQTLNGVTFTFYKDSKGNLLYIDGNGTATANSSLRLTAKDDIDYDLWSGKTLRLTGCQSGGSNNTYALELYYNDGEGHWNRDFGNGVNITLPVNKPTEINPNIMVKSGVTLNHAKFYPMITLASDPDDTYQPYAMTNRELTEVKNVTATAGANVTVNANTNISKVGKIVSGSLRLEFTSALTVQQVLATLSDKPVKDTYAIGIESQTNKTMPIIILSNGRVLLFGSNLPTDTNNHLIIPVNFITA